MPLNPGNDTVTFYYPGVVADRLHNVTSAAPITTMQAGCSMQPVTVNDRISDTAYSEATDRCICPSSAVTEAVAAEWFILFTQPGGTQLKYRVLGAKPFRDFWGNDQHITFMCKEEMG